MVTLRLLLFYLCIICLIDFLKFAIAEQVGEGIEEFTHCFNRMVSETHKALKNKGAIPRYIVSLLVLPDPKFDSHYEHGVFLDLLNGVENIDDLFIKLNTYWNHFNYHLLRHLISASGIEDFFEKTGIYELRENIKQFKYKI